MDELRINQRNSTISNLTNELSLRYTINNRFVVLLGMNLRIDQCNSTISNLTNELSLRYTINKYIIVLLGMN